ncbi:Endoglin CD105 antigen [Echinococcus multilocularis]|uniref:Endoglin CD105 antigen n=1 Tax=Echinococcus multilocularis TaxID=6211 RepID=A0A068XXR8_ECHMU|nr:Endoglin CD105 antigen [Echinococcus multilocularis]
MKPPFLPSVVAAYLHFLLLLPLSLPSLGTSSDKHLVFAGACNKESPSFCDRIVRNSVCNRAKNECFCRKGFVAVKEGDSVACKTLLTDLKCRVDADCVHINRSSCHPGAGFCTCPGNTVFVPQLNACRTKLFERKSLTCASCLQEGGSCFAFDENDNFRTEGAPPFERYGCVCPNLRTNAQFREPSRPQRTCGAQLVDIGQLCNDEDLLCRSPVATCSLLEETAWSEMSYHNDANFGICTCPVEHTPVFQKLLRYFECFPKLSLQEKSCHQCIKNGGECYRLTKTRTDCKCPLDRSNSHTSDIADNGVCRFRHVQTVCENAILLVCYVPHWEAPYEEMAGRMDSGTAKARLESSSWVVGTADPSARATCCLKKATHLEERDLDFSNPAPSTATITDLWRTMLLKLSLRSPAIRNATFNTPYCTQIDLVNDPPAGCGIRIHDIGGGRAKYQGTVEVVMEESLLNPARDLRLTFSCIDHRLARERREEILQHREVDVNVSMTIVNEHLQEVEQVEEGENISLRFNLLPSNSDAKDSIAVESCFASMSGSQFSSPSIYSGFPIYAAGCTSNNKAYRIQFEQSQLSGRQLQTPLFQVFRIENFNSLFIRCFVRYCPQFTLCSAENLDCANPAETYSGSKRWGVKYRLFDRWVHLNIVPSQKRLAVGRGNANPKLKAQGEERVVADGGGPCRHAVCLTQTQLITVSVITTVIIVVVLAISLIALRRQNQFRRSEIRAAKKPNCTTYEYVNWSVPVTSRDWSNQTSIFQPLVLTDSTIQRNPMTSIASSVYSNPQARNTAFIRSPNNAINLFHTASAVETEAKCRSFSEKRRTSTSEVGAWTVSSPTADDVAGKKTFTSALNEDGPFELQPVELYGTEMKGSMGLYAPFLCIRETSTIKNDTRSTDCFVVANNNSGVQESDPSTKTQFILQKAPSSSSQTAPTQSATLQRMYVRPNIGRTEINATAIKHFSSMKFLTRSEDEVNEREVSLSPNNILNDEQNV